MPDNDLYLHWRYLQKESNKLAKDAFIVYDFYEKLEKVVRSKQILPQIWI